MIHLPLRSTLFPYTTLFRSIDPATRTFQALRICVNRELERLDRTVHADPQRDRKSTRLNSSHSQISYAVFCLKKKNKRTIYCDSTRLWESRHSRLCQY